MKILLPLLLVFLFGCHNKSKNKNIISKKNENNLISFPVITQNLKHLKKGAELIITIHAEPITSSSNPSVIVNGTPVPFGSVGVISTAIYVINVDSILGEHSFPVSITHRNSGEKLKIDNYTISYFVNM